MSVILGAIADDFTGATDLANTLVRQGMRTVQLIDVPSPSTPVPDIDAVVVALKSAPSRPTRRCANRWPPSTGCAPPAAGNIFSNIARPSIPPMTAISARLQASTGRPGQ